MTTRGPSAVSPVVGPPGPPLRALLTGTGPLRLRGLPAWLRLPYATTIALLLLLALMQVAAESGVLAGAVVARASFALAYAAFALGLYTLATGAMDLPFLPRRTLLLVYAVLDLTLMTGPYDAGPDPLVLLAVAFALAVAPWERLPLWATGLGFAMPPLLGLLSTLSSGLLDLGTFQSPAEDGSNPVFAFSEVVTEFGAAARALASAAVLLVLVQVAAPAGRGLARPLEGERRRAALALGLVGVGVVVFLALTPWETLGGGAARALSEDSLTEWLAAAGAAAALLHAARSAHVGAGALSGLTLIVGSLALPEVLAVVLRMPAVFAAEHVSPRTAMILTVLLVPVLAALRAVCRPSPTTRHDAVAALAAGAAGSLLVVALLRAQLGIRLDPPWDLFFRLNQVRLLWWLLPVLVTWLVLGRPGTRGRAAVALAVAATTFATGLWPAGLRALASAVEAVPGGSALGATPPSGGASLGTVQMAVLIGSIVLVCRTRTEGAVLSRVLGLNLGVLVLAYAPLIKEVGGLLPTAASVGLLLPLLWELLRKGAELNDEPQRRFKTTWFLGNVALTAPVVLYLTLFDSGSPQATPDPGFEPEPVRLSTYESGTLLKDLYGTDPDFLPSALSGQMLAVIGPAVVLIGLLALLPAATTTPVRPDRAARPGWLWSAVAGPLAVAALVLPLLLDRQLLPPEAQDDYARAEDTAVRDVAAPAVLPTSEAEIPSVLPSPSLLAEAPTGASPDCAAALSVVERWTADEHSTARNRYVGNGNSLLAGPPSEPGRRLGLRYAPMAHSESLYATVVYDTTSGFQEVAGGADEPGDFTLVLTLAEDGTATCEDVG